MTRRAVYWVAWFAAAFALIEVIVIDRSLQRIAEAAVVAQQSSLLLEARIHELRGEGRP